MVVLVDCPGETVSSESTAKPRDLQQRSRPALLQVLSHPRQVNGVPKGSLNMARRRTTTDADATVESPESIVADNGNQPESTPEATPKPRRTRKPTVVADGDETSTIDAAAAPDVAPKPRRTRAKAVEPAATADAAVVDAP